MRSLLNRLFRKAFRAARGQAPRKLPAACPPVQRTVHRTVLIVDDYVPFFDRSAGGKRMFEILKIMRELELNVTFASDEGYGYEPHTQCLRDLGVAVISGAGVQAAGLEADVVWLSRPHIAQKYMAQIQSKKRARIIFDTVDLHYRRLNSQSMRELEISLARAADRTVVTTDEERAILEQAGIESVCVVPVVTAEPLQEAPAQQPREGLLFLGNYTHAPNVEAAEYLCKEILPLVHERLPSVRVTLAGAEPTARIRALADRDVHVTGYVEDLGALFASHRVFVAPLRTGAGLKGKLVEALAHGVPVVTTALGAEGLQLEHGRNALLAEDAAAFSTAVLRAYTETQTWNMLSHNGLSVARRFTPQAVRAMVRDALDFTPVAAQ